MANRQKQIIKTGIISVIVNFILAVFKMLVGLIAGSIAIILDAVNNTTDVVSSLVTIVGAKLASKRPDPGHPYGHGRSEYISAFLVGLIILVAGIVALFESVPKIIQPELADYSWATILVVSAAIIVKLSLGSYVRKAGRRLNSSSLAASGLDALFDAVLSAATLVGIIVTLVFQVSIDGLLGALIALFIIRASLEIISEAAGDIIGRTADPKLISKVKRQIASSPNVSGVYDLMLHNYGPANLIGSVQIQVPDAMLAREIHKLTRDIAHRTYTKFGVTLAVGIYVENSDQPDKREMKQALLTLLNNYPEVHQMHAFYVDDEEKLITFDLVVDYQYREVTKLKRRITSALRKQLPEYKCLIRIDSDLENSD